MSDRNAEAWAEIAAFLEAQGAEIRQHEDYRFLEEWYGEGLDDVNDMGEVSDVDEDDIPEGYIQCDSCACVFHEEDMVSTTYGYVCEWCDEVDAMREDY